MRTRRTITACVVVLLAGAVLAVSAVAATTTSVVAGWPRHVGAGTVHQGPGGGVVVISMAGMPNSPGEYVVTAYRRDGRRLWENRDSPGCGNCDFAPQSPARQPDATYGPIGPGRYAVGPRGGTVRGCSGVVTPRGDCYFVEGDQNPPALLLRDAIGDVVWNVSIFDSLFGPMNTYRPWSPATRPARSTRL